MATILNYGRGDQPTIVNHAPLPPDPSCQPCPDCGGLECLCRPRFFAGQLLSEQDLNRLDHYITEKHKLHNRHLWGSGVVCGLEVKCAPCDSGFVTVTPGYALSPCGEDIVVCKADTVDICALIARCRVDSEPDCAPYRGQESCGDVIEDWILAVRYAESPSRGITALTGAGQGCGCSCGTGCSGSCGGSCGGNCGCGGGASCSCALAKDVAEPDPLRQPRLNRSAPPSCEPTLTCETYRCDVFRAPVVKPEDPGGETTGFSGIFAQLEGAMMARIACCLKELETALPTAPGDISAGIPAAQQMAWFQWGCMMRTALANYFVRVGGHNCQAIAQLQMIVVPSPNPNQPQAFQDAMTIAVTLFALLVFEAIIACICSNALPPCPAPGDPRVPLALVKVRRRDCWVISVCNWHPLRKHVLTFPTLGYWFGFIPIARILREAMHRICCDLFGLREFFGRVQPQPTPGPPPPPPPPPPPAAGVAAVAQPMTAAFSLDQAITVDPFVGIKLDTGLFETVAQRMDVSQGVATWGDLGAATLTRPAVVVDPALQGLDRANAVNRVASTGPLGILAGMFASGAPVAAAVERGDQRDADIAELKAMAAEQAREITALKAVVKPAAGSGAKAATARPATGGGAKAATAKPAPSGPTKPRGRGQ